MTEISEHQERTYQNVMELVVAKEINRQISRLPAKVAEFVDPIDVAAYALNRLPALYAASKQGKEKQEIRIQKDYQEQIKLTVKQAIAAVQRDPLRISAPLMDEIHGDYQKSIQALRELEDWLKKIELLTVQQIDWDNLLFAVKGAFYRASRGGVEVYLKSDGKNHFPEWDNVKSPRS
jgi:asparagine synthetase A